MFCYNCGTKLPDCAKFCFSCGVKLAVDNDKTSVDTTPKKSVGKKYTIGEYTITFDEIESKYIRCNSLLKSYFWRNCLDCKNIVQDEIKDFDDILNKFLPRLEVYIYTMVGVGVETLIDNSIDYIDHQTLHNELMNRRPFEEGLKDLIKAVYQFKSYGEQLSRESSSGMRFTGGGYGITGAVTGAIKAEVLNMGMDALKGFGKWITGNTDSDKMHRFKEKLFKELHDGNFEMNCFFYWCSAVELIVNDILVHEGVMERARFNSKKSSAKLNNLKKMIQQDDYSVQRVMDTLFEGLLMDPYNIEYYDFILHVAPNTKVGLKILAKDCGIYEVFEPFIKKFDYDIQIENAKREREKKLLYIKKFTSDKKILEHLDDIVINQQELDNMLEKHTNGAYKRTIYLTQNTYDIPVDKQNLKFVGLGQVTVNVKSDVAVDFENNGIFFINIDFDDDYKKVERAQHLINEGIKQLKKSDYRQAAKLFAESRKIGNVAASWFLGMMFKYGLGLPQSNEQANALYVEGDKKIDRESAGIIANFCKNGELFTADYEAALQWYEKSEKNVLNLMAAAEIYERGMGVPKNKKKATLLYHQAADTGDCEALYRYAMIADISLNDKQKIFDKAASQGHSDSIYQLGLLHAEHYNEVFDETLTEGATKAFSYFRLAAEKGNREAQYHLGVAYLEGNGVEQSNRLAVDCFRKAVDKGHSEAMVELGVCYANGTGIKQDYARAVKLYLAAATLGNDEAYFNLGLCYQYGLGVNSDSRTANEWYKKAASKGNEDAKAALAELNSTGREN